MVLVFEMHVQLIDTGIDEFFCGEKGVKRVFLLKTNNFLSYVSPTSSLAILGSYVNLHASDQCFLPNGSFFFSFYITFMNELRRK